MPTTDLISRLRRYNEWRRGADIEQPDPQQIGRDIDDAIEGLEELEWLREAVLRAQRRFYEDKSDITTAVEMYQILDEGRYGGSPL